MSSSKPVKFQVEVWDPAKPRWEDYHEKHRQAGIDCGSRRAVGRLFRREYPKRSSANQAVPNLRRQYPGAVIELRSYEFEGFFWMQRGELEVL